MVRVYRYRLYPSQAQAAELLHTLELLRELYNAALQERRDAYQKQGVTLSAYKQMAELRSVREVRPDLAATHTHLLQDAITRLDRAFSAFFRRVKSGEKAGFPRFKGRGRYRTFTFKDAANRNGARLVAGGNRLELAGIGKIKIKLHRPYEGVLKQISVTLCSDGHWYAAFTCCDVPEKPLAESGAAIGVAAGITSFAVLSSGQVIDNSRWYESAQRNLQQAQHRVSRRRKGSCRRRAAMVLLAKRHSKVARVRRDFHHKVALALVRRFDIIHLEVAYVPSSAAPVLGKQVYDAAWGQFTEILAGKAESAGRELVEVNLRSKCSGCGEFAPKAVGAARLHVCSSCGLVQDRDHNATINVQQRLGHSRRGGSRRKQPEDPRSPFLAH